MKGDYSRGWFCLGLILCAVGLIGVADTAILLAAAVPITPLWLCPALAAAAIGGALVKWQDSK